MTQRFVVLAESLLNDSAGSSGSSTLERRNSQQCRLSALLHVVRRSSVEMLEDRFFCAYGKIASVEFQRRVIRY